MALKKVDFKQILLEKGERIGLLAGVAVMALLVIGFGLGSALSEGPQKKVQTLQDLRNQAQMAFNSSAPDETLEKLPDELNVVELKPVDPAAYPANLAFFQGLASEDRKWRLPAVLAPDEFQVDLVRGAVQVYILGEDGKGGLTIGILTTKTGTELTEQQRKSREEWTRKLPGMQQKLTKRQPRLAQLPTAPGVPGAPGIPGAPGVGRVPGRGEGGDAAAAGRLPPGMRGMGMVSKEAIQEHEVKMVSLERANEDKGKLAESTLPVRILQVSAAFPYKEQLEQFRKALRVASIDDLFAEEASTPIFTGFGIQRKVYGPDGKALGDWTDFDYETPMRQLRIPTKELEPEDPLLETYGMILHPNGLVLPRPKLAHDQKYPEPKLPGLEQTKEEMEKAVKANAPPPPKVKNPFKGEFDLFEGGSTQPGSENVNAENAPGERRLPGTPPAMGKVPPRAGARELPDDGSTAQKPAVYPDKVLVRFLDVTVQPGYSYEYKIKIRMRNPNYVQKDRAVSRRITKDPEIESDWQDVKWKQNDRDETKFHVSDELLYYVVQEEGQAGDGSKSRPALKKDEAVVQIHRWLDYVRTRPDQQGNELPVGDWTILKERTVHRGEYVGEWKEVKIPAWLISQDRYGFAVQPDEQKGGKVRGRGFTYAKHEGIPVDFATDPVFGQKALVVDFEGGERTLTRDGKPVKVNGPVEMLIYTADGKLVVHNSQRDTADAERQQRLKDWEQWITTVKNQADNPNPNAQENLFNRPTGKGRTPSPGGG